MESSLPLIITKNLKSGVGNLPILNDINWTVFKGQHWIITGEIGAGKTILAKTIARKCRIMEGHLELGNGKITIISFTDTSKLFRNANTIHYYQQRFNAFDADGHLTVNTYLKSSGYDENNLKHTELIQNLGMQELMDKERIKLSSGQTRKMFLARAILSNPQLLILDNPYIGLDASSRIYLNNLLDKLVKEHGITLILSGHYEQLPHSISHRIHLAKGKVICKGKLEEVAHKLTPNRTSNTSPILAKLVKYYRQNAVPLKHTSVIRLEDVSVKYGDTTILKNLSWNVLPGEKWVLQGNNGSGKSTLISLIYGDNPQAYANKVFLFDKRRGRGQSIWEVKALIGFTSSELHAFFDANPLACDLVFTGLFDGFTLKKMPSPEVIAFGKWLFQYFEIEKYYTTPFNRLSTGTQRLLFFLRALIKVPPVLFLDEPFQGMDDLVMQKCRGLLDQLLDDRHTLIFVTHFEKEIPQQVNQILDLNH